MQAEQPDSANSIRLEEGNGLSVRVWEAIGTERELRGVLAAAADAVVPIVPFEGVGIVILTGGQSARPYLLHLVNHAPRPGESCPEFLARTADRDKRAALPPRPQAPYTDLMQSHKSGEPYVCPDLLAKPAWYRHEFKMAAVGIRAYVAVPLLVRGETIGVASFSRMAPAPFTAEQVEALQEVSRPLAVAVSNALAYEEIRKLRDQLAAENIALKEQLGQMPWAEEIVGNSDALRRVLEAVAQVAATDATVLITGETGTGKELIARAIHRRSRRPSLPDQLLRRFARSV